MKKLVSAFILAAMLLAVVLPVAAEGISVFSESGDRVSLFEDLHITDNVKGNVIVILGNAIVEGDVDGIVVTVFGDAQINSRVSEQVVTVFGNTTMGEKSSTGNLITLGSVHKAEGTRITGNEVRIFGEMVNIDISAILYLRLAILVVFTTGVLIIGLLVLTIQRKKYEAIAADIEQKLDRKMILGLLSYFGASILLVMLAITLVAPILYLVLLIMASIVASIFAGRLILKAFSPTRSIMLEFVTGLITITLVKVLIIYLVPQQDIMLSLVLLGIFAVFINSAGLGIIMDARAAKK